ncbi:MAG: DNA polymerase III subunit delta [Thermodesulfobacteriota bacterium]
MKARDNIYPIYFLYGPENFLIEEETRRLLDQTLTPSERGFNLQLFSGEEHTPVEIVQAAQTLPMFSKYRFIFVGEADRFDEKEIKPLVEYIQNPSPSTCLVMVASTSGPWKKFQKEIEKVGEFAQFSRLKGRSLISWVQKRMSEKGKTLSKEAAEYLVEVVGDHLHDLENALEKAFLSVGEKKTIALSDVEGMDTEVKTSTVFDLMDAIGHQNLEKALGILEKAMESRTIAFRKDEGPSKRMDDPIPLLLSMMAKQYRSIWRIKEISSRDLSPAEAANELGTSPWNVRKLMEQGRYFSETSLKEGILKCHETDLLMKKGRGPKALLVEKLVIDLCRPSSRATIDVKR